MISLSDSVAVRVEGDQQDHQARSTLLSALLQASIATCLPGHKALDRSAAMEGTYLCPGHTRRDGQVNVAGWVGASWVSRVRVEYRPRSSVLFYSLHFG